MKKLIFCLFLLIAGSTYGQKFNGGIIAGGVVSQVDGDNYGGYNKLGLLGGVFTSLNVAQNATISMELEFIQKGSRYTDTIGQNSYLLRYNYIEVPILFQYQFARRFSAEIGPAIDFLVKEHTEENGLVTPPATTTIPLRKVTLSGILGVNGIISNHFVVNFRINYSLLSIREYCSAPYQDYRYIFWQYGQFNNLLSLSLLWYFKPRDLK